MKIKDLYDMSKDIDNKINNIKNYNFEDYYIIKDKKIDSSECYDNYPVLYNCFKKNINFKNGEVFFKNSRRDDIFPCWLFFLRINSSINYICWNYHSYLDMKFREKLCNLLINKKI